MTQLISVRGRTLQQANQSIHDSLPKVRFKAVLYINIFLLESNLFGPELLMFSWDFIDSDN